MSEMENERDIAEPDYRDRVDVLRDRVAHLVVRDRRSVESAAERLVQRTHVEIGHTEETAAELLATVVDPRSVQASQIRQQRVRGNRVLHLLRTAVWTPLLLVDATNGRFVVGQTYLSDPKVSETGSAHLALPAPESPPKLPSLIYRGSRVAIASALDSNAAYVLQHNNWVDDIGANGILMPLLAGHVEFRFTDGTPRQAVGVVDGTSRTASAHRILGLTESEILTMEPTAQRRWLNKLMRQLGAEAEELVKAPDMRFDELLLAERKLNALTAEVDLIVGWGWGEQATPQQRLGKSSYVSTLNLALGAQNIEPKAFSAEAQKTLLAERAVNTLADYALLNPDELVFALGREDLTGVAQKLGFSTHRDERCAWLIRLMTTPKRQERKVINEVLGAKSFSAKGRSPYVFELALRSFSGQDNQLLDRARNAAVHALWTNVGHDWDVEPRPEEADLDKLEQEALAEVNSGGSGPCCYEVAARAVVPLLALGGLGVDRGSAAYRGQAAAVVDKMITNAWGIKQLMATIRASRQPKPSFPRLDDDGQTIKDGQPNTPAGNNDWLRARVLMKPTSTPASKADEAMQRTLTGLAEARAGFDDYRELMEPPYQSLSGEIWEEVAKSARTLSKDLSLYVVSDD
ncbi:hypothetical protein OOK36_18750 [Streptomyces sp. NBC_00365]|uniref:hypothetical protein n=1 Tax=Streptomyces sp. NBC_00365 TaxID=2975726 RepID=UPI00224E31BB|nr:hypothetical protein [Streptomyces sp. NBC_00365]MCX5090901.1 hypothetical protein [Streptomyces sp. NBC_00365]